MRDAQKMADILAKLVEDSIPKERTFRERAALRASFHVELIYVGYLETCK